jgi:hypothetical protein
MPIAAVWLKVDKNFYKCKRVEKAGDWRIPQKLFYIRSKAM